MFVDADPGNCWSRSKGTQLTYTNYELLEGGALAAHSDELAKGGREGAELEEGRRLGFRFLRKQTNFFDNELYYIKQLVLHKSPPKKTELHYNLVR